MNISETTQRSFLTGCFVQYSLQGMAQPEHREAITRILSRSEIQLLLKGEKHRWEFLTLSARSSLR
jgi:hypothetical protein